ncbi:hypothetical protein LOTGIDRAFT_167255 [Lottia gigantea]|uniref:GDNF/GAS1 domain-containing protein n=1 Tax=Lottia gigantea TaxID=225164 RepID=V3ZZL9_LOTGI|nr:hypothetical protein LOTGIDRAFT_167255 [Lottia gigantea]ESO86441.1 hypothetical protein LOTGIDRAFT_167255 [Lottia gigantea]
MSLIILVISLCCGLCVVNSAKCPNNPLEKITEFGELSRQLGQRPVSGIQPLCGQYCDEHKNSKYRKIQQQMFSILYPVCPPVGLEEDADALMDKTGGDCTALKGECARLASQTLDDGDAGRGEVCRSHKPTVECSLVYAKECLDSETKLYNSAFASYLRYYVSYCRKTQKPGGVTQPQSPPTNQSQIRCARLGKKCSKIAQKANVKNCSIMKKSYRCLDKYVKACKWMLSPYTLNAIQTSRSHLYNQCSLGADMMMGDENRQASGVGTVRSVIIISAD